MDESDPIQQPAAPIRAPMGPWKKVAILAASAATAVLLGLMVEDYRAEVRLKAYKTRLLASGEKLAVTDFVSKLPAASSNGAWEFMAAPAFTRSEIFLRVCLMVAPGAARVAWQQKELPDGGTNAWPRVLNHVGSNQPALIAIRAALQKPEMAFPNDYAKTFEMNLPHLEVMMKAPGVFTLAAVAEMRLGNRALALDHLLSGIDLVSRWREPVSISQEIRGQRLNRLAATTWELLQSTEWEDGQLEKLQRAWQSFDLRTDWLAGVSMDRAWLPAYFARYRSDFSAWGGVGCSACAAEAHLLPWGDQLHRHAERARDLSMLYAWVGLWRLGFSHADELLAWETHQEAIGRMRQAVALDSYAPAATWPRYRRGTGGWSNPMLRASLHQAPKDDYDVRKMAAAETVRRLALTATALHRHRLRHQEFPASLAALVPELLSEAPRDFMDGQPLRYHREADGRFFLWSVGEDLKDDGGDAASIQGRIAAFLRGRDWVWPHAASQSEVDVYHEAQAVERAAREAENALWKAEMRAHGHLP